MDLKDRIRGFVLENGMGGSPVAWLDGLSLNQGYEGLHVVFLHEYLAAWFMAHKRTEFEDICKRLTANPALKFFYGSQPPRGSPAGGKNFSGRGGFSRFVANARNEMALEAAKAIARLASMKELGDIPPVLLLAGPSGSGKTHLLAAVHEEFQNRGSQAVFCKAALFCSRMCADSGAAMEGHQAFWHKNRALILDDLQEIISDKSWQLLLAAIMDAALDAGESRALAFAICGRGRDLARMEAVLRSRLQNGLLVELGEPDLDVRLRCVEMASRERGLGLDREQLLFLARHGRQIPLLLGLLRKIEFFAKLRGSNPTMQELAEMTREGAHVPPPGWREILERVAFRLNLGVDEVMAPSRRPELVLARHVAMYLCRKKLGFSFPELGKIFGGRDHSTVMHGVRKVEFLARTDKDMRKLLTELESETG